MVPAILMALYYSPSMIEVQIFLSYFWILLLALIIYWHYSKVLKDTFEYLLSFSMLILLGMCTLILPLIFR